MSNKVHVKTGDEVVVINGKYRGKRGKVLQVSPSEGKVIVCLLYTSPSPRDTR